MEAALLVPLLGLATTLGWGATTYCQKHTSGPQYDQTLLVGLQYVGLALVGLAAAFVFSAAFSAPAFAWGLVAGALCVPTMLLYRHALRGPTAPTVTLARVVVTVLSILVGLTLLGESLSPRGVKVLAGALLVILVLGTWRQALRRDRAVLLILAASVFNVAVYYFLTLATRHDPFWAIVGTGVAPVALTLHRFRPSAMPDHAPSGLLTGLLDGAGTVAFTVGVSMAGFTEMYPYSVFSTVVPIALAAMILREKVSVRELAALAIAVVAFLA